MRELGAKLNLVICQKSKIDDWINHFKENYEFGTMLIADLTNEKQWDVFFKYLNNPTNFTKDCLFVGVINYDLVWRRSELLKLHDFTLMLDESSLITNRTANRSEFILHLNPTNVILLSGTPTAGKYEKLWSQIKLLGWDIDEDTFWKSYVDYKWVETNDGYWEKQVNGYKNINHLKRKLGRFGAIFKKTEEVIDLPEQVEQCIYIEPTKLYKQYLKNHYVEVDGQELVGDNILAKITHERQLCGQYCDEKLKAFRDLVESTEDRIVVFYNFTEEWHKMAEITDEIDRPSGVVNGQFKHPEVLDNHDNGVLFLQYQAGAYGLNLQKANRVIYFTLPLGIGSCDIWEQSKKRIHRIGQDQTCFYYYLIVRDSIETWNMELLKTGKELTDELFKEVER